MMLSLVAQNDPTKRSEDQVRYMRKDYIGLPWGSG